MKRAIFYDYGNGQSDLVIDGLKKAGIIDTIIWIDNVNLFNSNCKKDKRIPLRKPDYDWFNLREVNLPIYEYKGRSKDIKEELFKYYYDYLLKIGREDIKSHANLNFSEDNNQYSNSSIYAMQNIFFMLLEFFVNLIEENKIEIIYFNNIPHDGADFVLYLVAKKSNIKVVMATPLSVFSNKFAYFYDVDDFGDFEKLPVINENKPYIIDQKNIFKKSYTDPLLPFSFDDSHIDPYIKENFLGIKTKYGFRQKRKDVSFIIKHLFRSFKPKTNIHKLCFILLHTVNYLNFTKFKKNQAKFTAIEVNMNEKFVFFPLHMQPEATTLAFAKVYYDQILAIEKISDLIPDDWKIYVKDHYAQSWLMRDDVFYKRLEGIKKAVLVPMNISTFDLMEKSQFVSTITGTAGWESIIGGKNALIFGNAWYKEFPGVFKCSYNLTFEEIINYKINYDELESKIGLFRSKILDGIIDCDFYSMVDNFDRNENIKTVINSLSKILGDN